MKTLLKRIYQAHRWVIERVSSDFLLSGLIFAVLNVPFLIIFGRGYWFASVLYLGVFLTVFSINFGLDKGDLDEIPHIDDEEDDPHPHDQRNHRPNWPETPRQSFGGQLFYPHVAEGPEIDDDEEADDPVEERTAEAQVEIALADKEPRIVKEVVAVDNDYELDEDDFLDLFEDGEADIEFHEFKIAAAELSRESSPFSDRPEKSDEK
jgi:hypothetical protein